ncbi:MAG: peptidylprolyl isomerase [Gemmatimonadales bacterium]|nr:peptidylprolyl isomerase [Gemmatimonadales bacterium]
MSKKRSIRTVGIPLGTTIPYPVLLCLTLLSLLLTGCWQENSDREDSRKILAGWEDARLAPGDSLVALMTGGDAHIRLAAVRTAGLVGRTDILPEMIAALEDPSNTIGRQAAFSLGLLGDERAIPALAIAADSPRPALREAALAGLGRLPNDGQALLKASTATSAVEAALAWDGLRNMAARVDSSALHEAVLTGLARSETDIQWRVLRCLERFPVLNLFPQIAPYAKSDDAQVRVHAYRALSHLETVPALQTVMTGWADHDHFRGRHLDRVQINGLRTLGILGELADGEGVVWDNLAAILIQAAGSNNPHVAETALVAMSRCVQNAPLPAEAADQESLLPVWRIRMARAAHTHLDDKQLGVKVAAVGAWADLRGTGAGSEIVERLAIAEDPRVQASLLGAISRIHEDPLPLLIRYTDPSHRALVRESALSGLVAVWTDRLPQAQLQSQATQDLILDLLVSAARDADFVVATTAANHLGRFPSPSGLTAMLDLWERAEGPDRSDLRLGVLTGLKSLFPATNETAPSEAWCTTESLLIRTAEILRAAFDSPDLRIRLEARSTALESGLLAEKLIPTAASLQATLPAVSRHQQQPAVAVPGSAPKVKCLTDRGDFIIKLNGKIAPNTCAVFLDLINRGYYEDLIFHRVVPDFVVQGGDPRGDGWGGPGYCIRSEWSETPYRRAAVGIAHSGKDTGGSQFFVTLSEQPHLNSRYTVFGEVVKGMDVVDRIQIGDRFKLEVMP